MYTHNYVHVLYVHVHVHTIMYVQVCYSVHATYEASRWSRIIYKFVIAKRIYMYIMNTKQISFNHCIQITIADQSCFPIIALPELS